MKIQPSQFLELAVLLLTVTMVETAYGDCAAITPEYMNSTAGMSKCGFTEFPCQISTPPKYYLVETVENNANASVSGSPGDNLALDTTTTTTAYPTNACSQTNTYAGSASDSASSCSGTIIDPIAGTWSDPCVAYPIAETAFFVNLAYTEGGGSTNETCSSTSDVFTETGSWTYGTGSVSGSATSTSTLSTEFTDGMLYGYVVALLPPYQAYWTIGVSSAFYTLSSDHTSAAGGKMKYRFHITDCIQNQKYLVTWDEITTYPNSNQTPVVSHLKEKLTGNGDMTVGVYTNPREKDVPATPSTITIANWSVTYDSSGSGGGPGSGGPDQ
jgi:hypothetical protein